MRLPVANLVRRGLILSVAGLAALVLCAGCGRAPEAKSELEKAEKTFAAQPPPAPEPAPAQAAEAAETQAAPAANPAQEMRQAVVAYKAGQMEDAVVRLQKLRAARALTPEQRMALQDSIAAVMTEIYDLASKGDPRAIQAVRQYEEMQNRRR